MAVGMFARGKSALDAQVLAERGDFSPADRANMPDDPVACALEAGCYGLLVSQRDALQDQPGFAAAFQQAVRAIDEQFALVPEGIISLPLTVFDQPGYPEKDCETGPFLLARSPVTNAQYQHFVDAGGYEDVALWPEEIWPHLIGFKDLTGQPGPRFWRQGRHDRRLAKHPVVGVCYYEAAAYATWAGFRLPTEPEWQMAACWRVRSAAHVSRRYPWGDNFDIEACNIWASGHRGVLPVDACSKGTAPNGVQQLIGNVWEWTSSDFAATDREGRNVIGDTLMKGIRGGAFDTYFAWQATSSFRSALTCLSRAHNVGVRCAMDLVTD